MSIEEKEKALVHSFGVGHGDCTLLEYIEASGITFRMLVDGGASVPMALILHLKDNPRPDGTPQIDVVVLTHVDYDHQGGLIELLAKSISIGEYWGPCLPAFRRLRGIFKLDRIQRALDSAELLEKSLTAAGVQIVYPLEGYIHRFCENKVVVSMISPSARLIGRLLTASGDDLAELLAQQPLPLEWLFGPDPDEPDQLSAFPSTATMTTPGEIAAFRPPPLRLTEDGIEDRAREALGCAFEPDFFGNEVLNDTSLVMTVDFHINQAHRRRVLLTGDQENWSYIAYKNPNGLGADLLKAPHHGGRVYLADKGKDVVDQLYLWLRPSTVITSASGLYNLPRLDFRNAVRMSGANLLCPNVRTFEPLSAGAALVKDAKSCHATYGCSRGKGSQRDKITITLTATAQSTDIAACVQGTSHAGLAPVRVLEQRVVEPDQSFVRWTHTEVEKYAKWLQDELDQRFTNLKAYITAEGNRYSDALHIQPIPWRELKDKAIVDGHFNLAANPKGVLTYGVSRGMFWTNVGRYFDEGDAMAYRRPSNSDIKTLKSWIASYEYLAFPLRSDPIAAIRGGNKFAAMQCCSWEGFVRLLGVKFLLPAIVAEELLLPVVRQTLADEYSAAVYRKVICWGNAQESKRWLVLTKAQPEADFPDDLKSEFLEVFSGTPEITADKLQALLEGTTRIFACLLKAYDNGELSTYIDDSFSEAISYLPDLGKFADRWELHDLWRI